MKRIVIKTIKIVAGIILAGLLFFLWAYDFVEKGKKKEVEISCIRWAGMNFAGWRVNFPRDNGSTETEQLIFLQKRWHLVQNDMSDPDYYDKFCDANIWTVVKNLPENPPHNLIVLATRNIDPSSLRTRLTEADMHRHIQFNEQFESPQNLPVLKKHAVLIRADGSSCIVQKGRSNETTYEHIYRGIPFYLPTNPVNGLQVKYLTSDGEVIPAND